MKIAERGSAADAGFGPSVSQDQQAGTADFVRWAV
jgi:hypothetical protein